MQRTKEDAEKGVTPEHREGLAKFNEELESDDNASASASASASGDTGPPTPPGQSSARTAPPGATRQPPHQRQRSRSATHGGDR